MIFGTGRPRQLLGWQMVVGPWLAALVCLNLPRPLLCCCVITFCHNKGARRGQFQTALCTVTAQIAAQVVFLGKSWNPVVGRLSLGVLGKSCGKEWMGHLGQPVKEKLFTGSFPNRAEEPGCS